MLQQTISEIKEEKYFSAAVLLKRPSVQVAMIDGETGFDNLKSQWDALVKKCNGTLFVTHDWLKGWWKFFGKHKNRHLHILVFSAGKKIVGIAPLYVAESAVFGLVFERRLNLMGVGRSRFEMFSHFNEAGFNECNDLVVDPEYSDEVADKFVSYLTAHQQKFDSVHFLQVNEESFIADKLPSRLREHSLSCQKTEQDICPYLDIRKNYYDFEDYLYTCSKTVRKRIRRALRDHKKSRNYTVHHCMTEEEKRKACEDLIQLHQTRWNSDGEPGKFSDKRFHEFYRYITDRFIQNNQLAVKTAAVGDRCIAVDVAVEHNSRLYSWLNAYDPHAEASRHSPGIGLLTEYIKESFNRRLDRIDMLRGQMQYKKHFTSSFDTNYKYTIDLCGSASLSKAVRQWMFISMAVVYKKAQKEYKCFQSCRTEKNRLRMVYKYIKDKF